MKSFRNVLFIILGMVFTFQMTGQARAATSVGLGTADGFAILAGSAITNTGATTVSGDVGSSPIHTETGFGPGVDAITFASGANHNSADPNDATTQQAKTDLVTAYNNAAGQSSTADLTGQDLGGMVLTPGVYTFSSSAQLTGALTLNGNGYNGVFIFQIGSTLTTASGSSVVLENGAQQCNVFWQVGSSATLGTTTSFAGTIMALTSITLNTGATIDGRALARNGAVTLDTNTITSGQCVAAKSSGTATTTGTATPSATATATPGAVNAPALPNAGLAPKVNNSRDGIALFMAGIAAVTALFIANRRKKLT